MSKRTWRAWLKLLAVRGRQLVTSSVDAGDVVYACGVIGVAYGSGYFHPGAPFICGGLGAVFPFVVQMLKSHGHAPKDKP